MRIAFHIANGFFVLAFLLSAAVQLNDPDPVRWTLVYLAAAALCVAAWWKLPWVVPAALALIAGIWSAVLAPGAWGATWPEIFGDMQMKRIEVELARESLGLALLTGWMAVLAVRSRLRASRSPAGDEASS